MVAKRDNLDLRIEKGDMRDLSRFEDERFDLLYHPVSNCFIDNVGKVWKECYRVLNPDGVLIAGFVNPLVYIFDLEEWEKNKNLVVNKSIPYSDLEQLPKEQLEERIKTNDTKLGGGLLDSYIDTYIATRSIRL